MVTVTQFIRQAALKSGRIPLAMDKFVEYKDVNYADVADKRCYLCGGQTNEKGVSIKSAIKDTFNDRDQAKYPSSQSVCRGCAFCLSNRTMRNYSTVATNNYLIHPGRETLHDLLLEPPEPPFVFCIAVSGQKHVHFKSMISYDRDEYAVQMEETRVGVYRPLLVEILPAIEDLYTTFTKEEITTGRYSQNRIKEFGLKKFQQVDKKIAIHRGQCVFDLAVFIAQKHEKPEKIKEEQQCITTLTPTIVEPQLALF